MYKVFTSLCALSLATAFADQPFFQPEAMPQITFTESLPVATIEESPKVAPQAKVAAAPAPKKATSHPVTAFTGKVKARKVRLRLQPDLESRIIKELSKNDLVAIVGEQDNFWAVEPPSDTKAYVFRSFVLDNVVEGNRVNIRLEPHLDAPIIGHFSSGDRIDSAVISATNNKWLEIAPPEQLRFYVAKDYIEYAGGPEVKAQMDKRHATAEQLLDATAVLAKSEMRKSFEEIDFDRIANGYATLINDFHDFPELVEHAKEALASVQENYLEKRIAFLEANPQVEQESIAAVKSTESQQDYGASVTEVSDRMKLWEPVEDALFLSWSAMNDGRSILDFYEEQKYSATTITGIVEPYTSHAVKNKPGDFIIRDKDLPVGYAYSTQVNLQSLVGKRVTLNAVPRPNNNFAFPAFFVLSVE
ncbi:MAG: hypothetical protein JSS61_00835 [Verrucomicrobia bacterium]|nr:hypothetical protein [Verrucomicrobiota bacterium]